MKKFSWDIGFYCDFKCPYCFFTRAGWDVLARQYGASRSPETIEQAWTYVFEKYGFSQVFIEGGEPFQYPSFSDIVARISRYHAVHITSNLSRPLAEFIEMVSPEQVTFSATFHPLFMDYSFFAQQVLRLRKAGFRCVVSYLAYPLQFREALSYKKYFRNLGIDMSVTDFWGDYEGKAYPQAYTAEEREYCRYVNRWDGDERCRIPSTINQMQHTCAMAVAPCSFDAESKRSRGRQCNAGRDYAVISADGSVRPCGQVSEPVLGNIYRHDMSLRVQPVPCDADFCKCGETGHMPGCGRQASLQEEPHA